MSTLNEGEKAPDFSLPANDGKTITLEDFKGKYVVLYFYPKDDTPGCTKEAQAFRDHIDQFQAANAVILGVSKDSVAKHEKFRSKYELPFDLISDEDGAMLESYGVWVEKNMYGKKYMGIQRTTFLIDGNGVIQRIWDKVKVAGHAEDVLAAIPS